MQSKVIGFRKDVRTSENRLEEVIFFKEIGVSGLSCHRPTVCRMRAKISLLTCQVLQRRASGS
jgi:hypothetical protein